jgi:RHS repeat-associated protein
MDKFGERYYDPSNLRWSQPDPIDQTGIRQGNGYLYVTRAPIASSGIIAGRWARYE